VSFGLGSRQFPWVTGKVVTVVAAGWVTVATVVGTGVTPGDVPVQPAPKAAARTMRTGMMAFLQFIREGLGPPYLRVVLDHKSVIPGRGVRFRVPRRQKRRGMIGRSCG
jgi:hypothetical protein